MITISELEDIAIRLQISCFDDDKYDAMEKLVYSKAFGDLLTILKAKENEEVAKTSECCEIH